MFGLWSHELHIQSNGAAMKMMSMLSAGTLPCIFCGAVIHVEKAQLYSLCVCVLQWIAAEVSWTLHNHHLFLPYAQSLCINLHHYKSDNCSGSQMNSMQALPQKHSKCPFAAKEVPLSTDHFVYDAHFPDPSHGHCIYTVIRLSSSEVCG